MTAPTPTLDSGAMVRQMQRHLTNLELRSNAPSWTGSTPAAKTSGYAVAEIPDWQLRQWIAALSEQEGTPCGCPAGKSLPDCPHSCRQEGDYPTDAELTEAVNATFYRNRPDLREQEGK